ncbi:MAG: hypothetical protein HY300_12650, partial [Verrucomicrobia bacterium]|nr:hypothetical protein [Verrucomicrobiota bacterium]
MTAASAWLLAVLVAGALGFLAGCANQQTGAKQTTAPSKPATAEEKETRAATEARKESAAKLAAEIKAATAAKTKAGDAAKRESESNTGIATARGTSSAPKTMKPSPKLANPIPNPALADTSLSRAGLQFLDPRSLPSRDEELWIISRAPEDLPAKNDDGLGCGLLLAKASSSSSSSEPEEVPVPLKHTEVKASVRGYIAEVQVVQQFHNPFTEKIEAVYVFPLPHNAAVNEFIMTIGERRIRGIIRERVEAEQIYREAKRQGYVASLLTQERPNVFTQSVANIEPGREIDVDLRYFQTLTHVDGWYEFVFPMVVGPRYNPPGISSGTGVSPVRTQSEHTGGTPVPLKTTYLRPGERSGHDIGLTV